MNAKEMVRTSKFLSLVLRHRPEEIGIELDEGGWVACDELIKAAGLHGVALDREVLEEIVRGSDKQRFALNEDGSRIRANQGHSVQVELGLAERRPPARLFHGTVERFLESIVREGLRPGNRHHVHLSADVETARRVGLRRGRPVVLEIRAEEMAEAGCRFYISENGVWLVDRVPPEFIDHNESQVK